MPENVSTKLTHSIWTTGTGTHIAKINNSRESYSNCWIVVRLSKLREKMFDAFAPFHPSWSYTYISERFYVIRNFVKPKEEQVCEQAAARNFWNTLSWLRQRPFLQQREIANKRRARKLDREAAHSKWRHIPRVPSV